MATRNSVKRGLLLSLALTIALPITGKVAFAAEQASAEAPAAPAAAAPAAPAAPAPTPTPAAEPAPAPTAAPAAAPEAPAAAPKAEAPAEKPKKKFKKGANFEQLEKHKDEGYYGTMGSGTIRKGDNYEQLEKHKDDGEGYYTVVPATPKEYPKEPEPPKYVPPAPEVIPVLPSSGEPGRKFDDDPGATGSITFTRHLKTAKEMLGSGHHDLAKKHFKEAIHIQPDNVDCYAGYIESCQKGNDWSETQRAIDKYLQLDASKTKEYEWQLGESWYHLQRYDRAVPSLKKSLAHGHHQEQVHKMLLKIAQQQNSNADVVAEYNALCKLKPGDYQTQLEFAGLLERMSRGADAIGHYKAAVNANPADGRTMGRLAYLMMFHNKDFDGAIAYYQKAMAADPASAATYQQGIAYCSQQKQLASQPKKK